MAAALDEFTATQVFTPQYADEQEDDETSSRQPQQPQYQQRPSSDPFDEEEQERQLDDQSGRALNELDDEQLLDDDDEDFGGGDGGEEDGADGDGGGDAVGDGSATPVDAQSYIPKKLVGYTSGTAEPWMLAPSPFPLADRQLYTKIGSNSGVWEVRPPRATFQGFRVGEAYTQKIAIVNVSKSSQRLHVLPLASNVVVGSSTASAAASSTSTAASAKSPSPFSIHFDKKGPIAPGMSQILTVRFEPREYRYFEDEVRLHMLGENMLLPLVGYPVMNSTTPGHSFPAHIDMGPPVPVGHRTSRRLELRCDVPIQFEYELRVLNPQEEFMIFPLKGIVPANGSTVITVDFCPKRSVTSTVQLHVNLSQFGFVPFVCTIVGHSHVLQLQRPVAAPKKPALSMRQQRLAAAAHLTALNQEATSGSNIHSRKTSQSTPLASATNSARPKTTLQRSS